MGNFLTAKQTHGENWIYYDEMRGTYWKNATTEQRNIVMKIANKIKIRKIAA